MRDSSNLDPGSPPDSTNAHNPRRYSTPIPAPVSWIIGRDREVDAALRLIRDSNARIITLTGPGGVGKTRLGLLVAQIVQRESPHDVAYVDLTSVQDPGYVSQAIADALTIRLSTGRELQLRLQEALRNHRMLLRAGQLRTSSRCRHGSHSVAYVLPGIKHPRDVSIIFVSRECINNSDSVGRVRLDSRSRDIMIGDNHLEEPIFEMPQPDGAPRSASPASGTSRIRAPAPTALCRASLRCDSSIRSKQGQGEIGNGPTDWRVSLGEHRHAYDANRDVANRCLIRRRYRLRERKRRPHRLVPVDAAQTDDSGHATDGDRPRSACAFDHRDCIGRRATDSPALHVESQGK